MARVSTIDPIMAREFAKFEKNLKKLEKLTMDNSGKVLWKYSTIFANGLIKYTQPSGSVKKARDGGRNRVHRDIKKLYGNAGAIYKDIERQSEEAAKAFWYSWKKEDDNATYELLRKYSRGYHAVAIVGWDGGRQHKQSKKKGFSGGNIRTLVKSQDSHMVGRYVREVQTKVGWSKAGWVSNFNPPQGLAKARIPVFVKQNIGNQGRVIDKTKNGITRGIDFENNVPWIKEIFWKKGAQVAINQVARIMKRDLEKAAVEAGKKV